MSALLNRLRRSMVLVFASFLCRRIFSRLPANTSAGVTSLSALW